VTSVRLTIVKRRGHRHGEGASEPRKKNEILKKGNVGGTRESNYKFARCEGGSPGRRPPHGRLWSQSRGTIQSRLTNRSVAAGTEADCQRRGGMLSNRQIGSWPEQKRLEFREEYGEGGGLLLERRPNE